MYTREHYINLKYKKCVLSLNKSYEIFWSYTRNGQYSVKSGYWVAQNLLKTAEAQEILEPSITKLQAFAWKLKAPTKICILFGSY